MVRLVPEGKKPFNDPLTLWKNTDRGDEMRHQAVTSVLVALAFCAAAPAGAQNSKVAKTAWGTPDLNGLWDFRTITPLERPANLADKEFLTEAEAAKLEQEVIERNREIDSRPAERTTAGGNVDRREDGSPGFYNNFWLDGGTKPVGTRRTSLVIDPPNGKVPPLTPAAQKRAEERRAYLKQHPADGPEDRSASDRCILGFNAGPPLSPGGYNQIMQVVQTKDHVVMVTEMVHTARIVPLDGRPRLNDQIRHWSGEARGHWEGDTLVIETTNFKPERGWRGATGNMKLIERLTRLDAGTLEYKYTVIDPDTWTSPWTASIPLRLSDQPSYEYACHEGNHSMQGILSGQRTADKEAAEKR
jgi:hypothetical protein